MKEPTFASIKIPINGDLPPSLNDLPVEVVPASEAWRIGLSAADVRWLLANPAPPRKPPTYKALLRQCERGGCEFTNGIADGWEFCPTHGTARKKRSAS